MTIAHFLNRGAFVALFQAYLEETGGHIPPTHENLCVFADLYTACAINPREGVALFAGVDGDLVGFTFASELKMPWATTWGKVAMGWGTYVTPAHRRKGYARQLRTRLDVELRARGFETIVGGYHAGNESGRLSLVGSGFEIFQTLGAKSLREDK